MIPGMMGSNINVPTIKELWKDEKSKYRHWVIILAIGLILITTLTIVSFVVNLVAKDEIIKETALNIEKDSPSGVTISLERANTLAKAQFFRNSIIFPILISICLLCGIVWYFFSLFKVYKHKNFAKLSGWPTLVIGIGALMSFVQLMLFAFSLNAQASVFATPGSIFTFVTKILFILIYFAASAPVSRLRKLFLISDRMEKLKNDPKFQTMQEKMQDMLKGGQMPLGPFGPVVPSSNQTSPKTTNQNQEKEQIKKSKSDIQLKRLKGLSVDKLKEVAKRLSISGYKKMKKNELIEAIIRVS